MEKVNEGAQCGQREFYLPQKAVNRDNAESKKLQIVHDASARENSKSLSFNLRWWCVQDLFGLQIPVTPGGFELRISWIQSS